MISLLLNSKWRCNRRSSVASNVRYLAVTGLFLVGGCAHKIAITTDPVVGQVKLSTTESVSVPMDTVVFWTPFKHQYATVSAVGYRPVTIDLLDRVGPTKLLLDGITFRWQRLAGIATREHREVLLIKEHGGAGTWTTKDAMSR